MSLRAVRRLLVLAVIGALVYWIATHTYWADQTVPRLPRGEALRDRFYAAERLARALGAHASHDRLWGLPAENAVVVMSFWDWDRNSTHRAQLQQWVESGGRLVTELRFSGRDDPFSRWSGITRSPAKAETDHHGTWKPGGCQIGRAHV